MKHVSPAEVGEQIAIDLKRRAQAEAGDTKEVVLGAIRSAVHRLGEIKEEVTNAGRALKAGLITPQMAVDWVEQFAPGCIGLVPEMTGIKTEQTKEAA